MANKRKLVLIDGYSLLFRAFFAVGGMYRRDGTPVNGVYGFIKMLLSILHSIKHQYVAIAFDTGKQTLRSKIYPQYKQNRPPCPKELVPQFSIVREFIDAFNMTKLEKIGYEADDLIATYTKEAEKNGLTVVIASSDKDLMQLINDNVFLYDSSKRRLIGEEDVIDKFGVGPDHVLDVLTLMGDVADNVPGARGIGPKTASSLINEFGSIENLLSNINNVKNERQRKLLEESIENINLSKKLIQLLEAPMDYTLEDLAIKEYDEDVLEDFLEKQEFYSIINELF